MIARWLWTIPLLMLAGCPETSAVTTGACERIGQPCQLPAGPMGVCNESLREECETPPCLACISQH